MEARAGPCLERWMIGLSVYKEMNMKAVVVHQYGGPEVLKFEEYPDPVAGPAKYWCGSLPRV